MSNIGMPALAGFQAVNWKLVRNVVKHDDPLGSNLQRRERSGQQWSAILQAPPAQNEEGEILASWLDKASRGDSQFYVSPPHNRFGGAWNPAELLANGTFLGGVTTGWVAQGSALSINARRLKVTNSGAGFFAAYQQVSAAEIGKPHVFMADIDLGNSSGAAIEQVNSSNTVSQAVQTTSVSARLITLFYPTETNCLIRVDGDNTAGHYFFASNISACRCLIVNGGGQSGNRLNVDGGPASTNQALRAGQFVTVRVKNRWQMLRLVEDFDTDSSGAGRLVFEPALRDVPVDGEAVILRNPFTRMYLPEHMSEDSVSAPNFHGIAIDALEDPTEQSGEIQSDLIWAWDADNLTLAPQIGSGTPGLTRANATATRINSSGKIVAAAANEVRWDYDPVTLALKGLLIEEGRSNLALRATEFDNATWIKVNSSVVADSNLDPANGAFGFADRLVESATTADHYLQQQFSKAASPVTYTASVYVFAAERTWFSLQLDDNVSAGGQAWFNIGAGSLGTVRTFGSGFSGASATITKADNAGWYRVSLTVTTNSSASLNFFCRITTGDLVSSYAGNGSNGLYVWGAQLEAGPFLTTFIPTAATAIARSADVDAYAALFAGLGISTYTMIGEATQGYGAADALNARRIMVFRNSSGSNRAQIGEFNGTPWAYVDSGGALQWNPTTGSWSNLQTKRLGLALAANDFAFAVDGASPNTATGVSMPATISNVDIGNESAVSSTQWNGWLRKLRVYSSRVPNQMLKALTA